MKKLFFSILVLGLLLGGNAYAAKSWLKKNNWHKSQYWKICKDYVPYTAEGIKETWNSDLHQCLKNMEQSGKWRGLDINPVITKSKENKKSKKVKINKEGNYKNLITQAKKACINLGFTAGTEKFADCSLKLIKMKSE